MTGINTRAWRHDGQAYMTHTGLTQGQRSTGQGQVEIQLDTRYPRRHDNRQDPQPTAPQWQLVRWFTFDVGAASTNKQINNETTGASVESWHSMAVDSQLISHNVRYILRDENSMNLNQKLISGFQSKVVIGNMRVINKMSDSENYGRVKTEIMYKIKTITVDIIVRWTPPNY